MVYIKYGNIFRILREQNNFSLSDFSSLGISKSALSKFERGISMMSFDKVFQALHLMGASLEDFENFLNGYSQNDSDSLMDEIERANLARDKTSLMRLEEISKEENYPYIALAAKASWTTLDEIEINKITLRLYSLELWSYKELCIFYLVIDQLSSQDIISILRTFLEKKHDFFGSHKYRNYLVEACCRAISALTNQGYKNDAYFIIQRIKLYNLANSMYLRNLLNLVEGYWIYCFKNIKLGNTMMLTALDIFKEVSTPQISQYYLERYNKLVIKKQ